MTWREFRKSLPVRMKPLIYFMVRVIHLTMKVSGVGYEQVKAITGPRIIAGWHGTTLPAGKFFRGMGFCTMISESRDGEIQNYIYQHLGFTSVRGSSSKGAVRALVEAIRVLKEGGTFVFTPDGPRGPSGIVQDGLLMMAQKSGAAIIPVGISANRRWIMRGWDKFMVPKPFCRAVLAFGDPIYVPAKADKSEVERIRLHVQAEIHRIQSEAERLTGH